MDHFREYMAAEVALDHAAGQISRRQALRQMGVMGLSLTAASAVLAACGNDKKQATGSSAPAAQDPLATSTSAAPVLAPLTTTARPATTPVPTQEVTYPGPNGTLLGAYAPAANRKGALVVVHENRGLVDNIRAVAGRLAGDGYSALAVDLLSEEGGTAKVATNDVASSLTNAGPSRL